MKYVLQEKATDGNWRDIGEVKDPDEWRRLMEPRGTQEGRDYRLVQVMLNFKLTQETTT